MIFELPPNLPDAQLCELERASIAGGPDVMPTATESVVEGQRLTLTRDVHDSGPVVAPWQVGSLGFFMISSATLMERAAAYRLNVELARGKLNQVRSQAADWLMGGLIMPDAVAQQLRQATQALSRALAATPSPEALPLADAALQESYRAAHALVRVYSDQVFQVRHSRQPRLDALLACRLNTPDLNPAQALGLTQACNAVVIPFSWRDIEPSEGTYHWETCDRLVQFAAQHQLRLIGGPLVDFAGQDLPDWLWEREPGLLELNTLLCEFIDKVVRRYQPSIKTWQVTAGSNFSGVLATRDDELLWLTMRLVEAVRRVNGALEVSIGIAQPWGDYLVDQARNQSPFLFVDNLLRAGLKVNALDLEIVMGIAPRGSFCRDTLDLSRLLDLYALLGIPLNVTLGYPSDGGPDASADPDLHMGMGWWQEGYTSRAQTDWAAAFASLALCKPYVRTVCWPHFSDLSPHQFPHAGLVDAQGALKAAAAALTKLRMEHLR